MADRYPIVTAKGAPGVPTASSAVVTRAVVLAGGAGSRLWPLTETVPKPLVEFATEPFLHGVIRRLADVGVRDIWVLIGKDPTPFRSLDALGRTLGVTVETVCETEPLGTAGGVRALCSAWEQPFFVLNGDILTDVDLAWVAQQHAASGAFGSLVVASVRDPSSFGVCQITKGQIVGFLEKPSASQCPGPALVNAGTYLIEPALLRDFAPGELSFERDVFPTAIRRGDVLAAVVSDNAWADLGTPARYRAGHRLVLDETIAWPAVTNLPQVAPGVRIAATATVTADVIVHQPVLIAAGATIHSGAVLGPNVVIGADVTVGEGCVLTDVVVHAGATLGVSCQLAHTVVGAKVTLGNNVTCDDDVVVVTDVAANGMFRAGARVHPDSVDV